jgi:hypothetical protein
MKFATLSTIFIPKPFAPEREMHVYEVRARKDHGGVDLISDALPFCRLPF